MVLTNVEGVEYLTAENHPDRDDRRIVPFAREIYIERDDFMEDAPKKFFRLKPGGEVRLKHAYIIKCNEVIKDDAGNVVELRCTIDPDSKSGGATANRKIKGTIHWVAADYALRAEVRLYDYLLKGEDAGDDFISSLNPESMIVIDNAMVEPSVRWAAPLTRYQFLRTGYFVVDYDSTVDKLVFNRIVGLKDTWSKVQSKG